MNDRSPDGVRYRIARPADRLGVSRVLDGALLDVEELPARIDAGHVLVAVADGRICGAVVVAPDGPPSHRSAQRPDERDSDVTYSDVQHTDVRHSEAGASTRERDYVPREWQSTAHVRAIAVRRRRRGRGIGSALVSAATEEFGPLVADFDDAIRPFYESLDATLLERDGERWWARVPP